MHREYCMLTVWPTKCHLQKNKNKNATITVFNLSNKDIKQALQLLEKEFFFQNTPLPYSADGATFLHLKEPCQNQCLI